MIDVIDIADVLFLDIETVSGKSHYGELSEPLQKLWKLKCRSITRNYETEITEEEATELYPQKAGIYAEFGQIVCISVGYVIRDPRSKRLSLRLTSFADNDERKVLEDFSRIVQQYYNNPNKHKLCGHNLREFDIPYICRRMVVHGLPLPEPLQLYGKKPWETRHLLDTMELWKFGDYKSYVSLRLLAELLGFPSPKDDIDGADVGKVYWEETDLDRIAMYCEKDVLAVVQLLLRYKRMPILEPEQIVHVK